MFYNTVMIHFINVPFTRKRHLRDEIAMIVKLNFYNIFQLLIRVKEYGLTIA
jgi:hypothetical protein